MTTATIGYYAASATDHSALIIDVNPDGTIDVRPNDSTNGLTMLPEQARAAAHLLLAAAEQAGLAIHNVVDSAVTALAPYSPQNREQVADMLLFWRRRAELTPADIAEVQDRLFPVA